MVGLAAHPGNLEVTVAKLVWAQLETCHANSDGVAWYAYYSGEPAEDELLSWNYDLGLVEDAPLGHDVDLTLFEEVPNALSQATNLRRYFVAAAC